MYGEASNNLPSHEWVTLALLDDFFTVSGIPLATETAMATLFALHQKKRFQRSWSFILNDEGSVHVQTKRRGGAQDFIVELRNLHPRSARTRSCAWTAWIFGGLLAAVWLVAMVSVLIGLREDPWVSKLTMMAFLSLILLPFVIKVLAKAAQETYDVTLFYNRWNQQAVLSIANHQPDAATAEQFISALTRQTELAAPSEVRGEGLADQVAKLDEMRQRGLLTDTEFATAKQRLLGGAEEKKIGFH
jgi:hypothetical protein